MTDFDSLLPPRVVAPRLPDRGGPAALLVAARRRRGQRTTMAGAVACASTAIVGLTGLSAPSLHSLRAEPTAGTTTTTVAPAKPRPSVADVVQAPSRGEQARRPAQAASATPRPSATPTARPTAPPRTRPRAVTEAVDPYTPVVRTVVADRPTEDCAVRTSGAHPQPTCLRIVAPPSVQSGQPADLAVELCARVRDASVTFAHDEEAFMTIEDAKDGEHWGSDVRPTGEGRHTERVPAGQCLRYTFGWNGLTDTGEPLPPGRYSLRADVPSEEAPIVYGGTLESITVT